MTERPIEQLATRRPVEVRAASGSSSRRVGGYASVFNSYSQDLGGFVERVAPSFFNKSRGDGWPGVICRWNHDDQFLLGSARAATLRLAIDNTGLNYTVDLPQCRSDVLELVSRGDIGHSSFAFQVYEQEWGVFEQNFPQRTLISGRLIDVAPVSQPAYLDSSVGLRSLAEQMSAPLEDVLQLAAVGELRKLFVRTDCVERRALSPAEAKARLMAKAPKPRLTPQQAKMRSLGRKYPNYTPIGRAP